MIHIHLPFIFFINSITTRVFLKGKNIYIKVITQKRDFQNIRMEITYGKARNKNDDYSIP